MEGGDAPVPPTAAMGKMSLDHNKRVYPQQAYTAAMPSRQQNYSAAPPGTFQPVGNAGAAGAAVASGGYQFPAGSGAQQPFAIGQPQTPPPNAAYQCPSRYMRFTTNVIPATAQMQQKSHFPLGAIVHPLATPTNPSELVPVVNFGSIGILRCRRCRSYINAFVTFLDAGRRWRCNLCDLPNEVPNDYFCGLNQDGRRTDVNERPELSHGIVEFVAGNEYLVRPPQPPVYFFVIDVSYYAVVSGMLASAVAAIKATLDKFSDVRTQVGFITFDSSVHFYVMKPNLSAPHMMVVGDVENIFLPVSDDLLITVSEAKILVTTLLDRLPLMFANTKIVDSALGPALRAAFGITRVIGGKILLFQCAMPNLGVAKLKARDDPKLLGTEKETQLLVPEESFYKNYALDCSRAQISVDTFIFASTVYTDVPALSIMSQITGGQSYFYPVATLDDGDKEKFAADIVEDLTRVTGFEAVIRVRCSKGVNIGGYYGNFFIRSNDLLALPNCDSDKAYACTFNVVENMTNVRYIAVQAALLYTTATRERRIRVLTSCLPVSSALADVFKGADTEALVTLNTQIAIDRALTSKLSDARDLLLAKCVDLLATYRVSFGANVSPSQLLLPDSLKLLPLYTLAQLKSPMFRPGQDQRPADRVAAMNLCRILPVSLLIPYIYPRLFALHTLTPEMGKKDAATNTVGSLPPVLNLSSEKFDRRGAFLLSDGQCFLIWVGKQTAPELIQQLFGVSGIETLNPATAKLVPQTSEFAERVCNILDVLRSLSPFYQRVHIVRETDPLEHKFYAAFIEDKNRTQAVSYYEFLQVLQREIPKSAPSNQK